MVTIGPSIHICSGVRVSLPTRLYPLYLKFSLFWAFSCYSPFSYLYTNFNPASLVFVLCFNKAFDSKLFSNDKKYLMNC